MALLRRLNENGISRLLEFLHSVKIDPKLAPPIEILEHGDTSEDLGDVEIIIEPQVFGSRYAAAEYLHGQLSDSGLDGIDHDRGVWAWLALFYFEELCPADKKGRRSPGQDARWVPESGHAFRYYRHLLAGPYRIFHAHRSSPDKAMILLCGPLHQPGDIVEQLASRQELVTNGSLLGTATALYLNKETSRAKRGVTTTEKLNGRTRGKPGTVRRLIDVYKQFDLAWDLYAMDTESVVSILPKEFNRFR
ncbi:MAG: hypothetical protein CME31_22450 [Gimesia sp.]|nr:hypothetical protein [Gimesia sp.]|tara:strand:- start:15068 stop:15814 length:747 start_codon:yes stop_codon:yes gene_type:complete